ncbi:MAG: protein kinase [Thermoanaerobaculia bacterium]|nr:protein kinase [Thermoanaerobaculia bacterium]
MPHNPDPQGGGAFPITRLSLVQAASSNDADHRQQAFGALIEAYWKAVYKYLRLRWHASAEDAQDLTQEFFARAFEKDFFARFDPERARFRTYLRTCLDGFAANERKAAQRLKRGGGAQLLSLDFESAEGELRQHDAPIPTTSTPTSTASGCAPFWSRRRRSARSPHPARQGSAFRHLRALRPRRPRRRAAPDLCRNRARARSAHHPGDQLSGPCPARVPPHRARPSAGHHRQRGGIQGRGARAARSRRAVRWLADGTLDHLRQASSTPGGEIEGAAGRYRILEPIGEGGMGTVYRAHDLELDREVALKATQLQNADPEHSSRLEREARILARLEHPGIVPVHDVGTLADGRLFYVMKLVRGHRLDTHVATIDSLAERLRLFVRICEPVAFAHAHGVLHRDLKPPNVMVGAFGEVLVMDWGVARIATDGTPFTAVGTILGTPGYMAPEQAFGSKVDERTDVYSLGVDVAFLIPSDPDCRASSPRSSTRRAPSAPPSAIRAPRRSPPTSRVFSTGWRSRPIARDCLKGFGGWRKNIARRSCSCSPISRCEWCCFSSPRFERRSGLAQLISSCFIRICNPRLETSR